MENLFLRDHRKNTFIQLNYRICKSKIKQTELSQKNDPTDIEGIL